MVDTTHSMRGSVLYTKVCVMTAIGSSFGLELIDRCMVLDISLHILLPSLLEFEREINTKRYEIL
jgi:hypothetical protein